MFDISIMNRRYFEICFTVTVEDEDGNEQPEQKRIELKIEPPKMKTLKRLIRISKADREDSMDELTEAVRLLLNKNKSGYIVSMDIIDSLDFDELLEILNKYFDWLGAEKKSPN
ncbi:MAG: hypothetical protein ACC608_09595 [Anaerofustis sp.]